MLYENLLALIEAIVESEFRRPLPGTKVFRKPLTGPEKAQDFVGVEPEAEPFQNPDLANKGWGQSSKGRINPKSHWTHPDHVTDFEKIKK